MLRTPDAEDIAQDTFVRAFVHFERFDPERPLLPWLVAIARRLCLDLLRRKKMMARVDTMAVVATTAPGPDQEALLREQFSRLERALADLDEGPREAILLFHNEEMSYRDIAAALEVPIGTVMTWLHRGRALVVGLTLLAGLAGAATPDTGRLEGRLPDNTPVVSIDQTRGTVLDALSALSKQAGWSLVVTAPESVTTRALAIQVSKRPAGDVLNLVLEAGSLRATFADGVLRVRSDALAVPGDSMRERRRERGRRRGADRVVFGQSLSVGADEVVDKAVAVGGSITISGHVRRDAVAVGGSVTLLPGARVEGDAVAIGGAVSVEEGAALEGDNVSLGGTIPTMAGSLFRSAVEGRSHLRSMFGFASRLTRTVLLFVIALLIAVAFPGHVTRVRAFLVSRPGLSSLSGIVLLLGFLPLLFLLAVTIVGIPLIPVAVMLLVALFLFGFTVAAGWLGEKLPFLRENKTPLKAVVLGGVVLVVVGLIPWIGTAAIVLAAVVSAGATLLSRFGRRVAVAAQ